jgi:WD40 repeat protein
MVISVWDLETGEEIFNHKSRGFERKFYAGFSRDGRQLITADEKGRIVIYDLGDDSERLSIQAHDGLVIQVRSSPDGMLLASVGIDQSVRLWDSQTGQKLATLSGQDNVV